MPALAEASLAERLAALEAPFSLARYDEVLPAALRLHQEAQSAGDPRLAAEVAVVLAKSFANRGESVPALDWAERGAAAAAAAGDRHVEASAWALLASERARCDRAREAMQAVDRVFALVDTEEDPARLCTAYSGLAFTYRALGMPLHALEMARLALAEARRTGDTARCMRGEINLVEAAIDAHDLLQVSDPEAAAALLDETEGPLQRLDGTTQALERRGEIGRVGWTLMVASVHARRGQWAAASALLEPLAQGAFEGQFLKQRDFWLELARVQAALGDSQRARESAARAAAQQNFASRPTAAVDLAALSRMAELQGDIAGALALAREHHARVLANVLGALDARVDELAARMVEQGLRLENRELRERNEGLTASVQVFSTLATTDALTGLANRRELEAAFDRATSRHEALALALIDLDHFKSINDRHSHLAGDAVLRESARLMAAALRGPDRLGRWGGEEFLALLPGADLPAAVAAIERVRGVVQLHDWSALVPGQEVTLSAGVVLVAPGEGFAAALERADALLYRAKREGRNRVAFERTGAGHG